MKKLFVAAVAALVLVLVTGASALTASGVTLNFNGTASFPNALVHIHNYSTGANGSTYSDSGGAYSFTGIVSGTLYGTWAEACTANPVSGHSYFKANEILWSGGSSAPWLKLSYRNPC